MRAVALPKANILTKAHRAAVSIMAKGNIELFLIFIYTTQLYQYFVGFFSICTI